jgi:hypothetical protein
MQTLAIFQALHHTSLSHINCCKDCGHQGNRISKHLQKFGEEGIIPSGAFEFSAQGAF